MTSLTSTTSQPDVRQLSAAEIDATAGAVLDPLSMLIGGLIAGGAVVVVCAAAKYLTR
ncbi:MAG: hypothetical protein AB7O57_08170 [Hyphomicrobiaceae bacterium]